MHAGEMTLHPQPLPRYLLAQLRSFRPGLRLTLHSCKAPSWDDPTPVPCPWCLHT